ncbi:MAG: flagellar basal body P-ring formation protein FlgA [Gammaproteobacteria bacterium]|nr:flagellar basal body P-ring formation protein FlgA [Gammaproteobacteria bacterium]MBQ0839503.1 flagellar basal body P-ring formation protein FlgA [Gammaproteobacteria bacterium]
MLIRLEDANKLTILSRFFHEQPPASSPLTLAAMLFVLLGTLFIEIAPSLAADAKFQSIASIKAAARSFLTAHSDIQGQANTTVSIGNIDARLTLPSCGAPLEAFLPSGANVRGKTTIGVRCQTPQPWTLYVPASVATLSQVLVSKTPLRRGHRVTADDVSLQSRDSSLLNSAYLSDPAQVVGKVLKRNLGRKALFTSALLTEPHIIDKGQHIDLQAGTGGLKVSVTAIALSGGAVGEKIRVKNLSSSKIVEGTILASGAVQAD